MRSNIYSYSDLPRARAITLHFSAYMLLSSPPSLIEIKTSLLDLEVASSDAENLTEDNRKESSDNPNIPFFLHCLEIFNVWYFDVKQLIGNFYPAVISLDNTAFNFLSMFRILAEPVRYRSPSFLPFSNPSWWSKSSISWLRITKSHE